MAGKTRPKLFLMGMDERNNLFSRCSMCCTNACEKKKKRNRVFQFKKEISR